MSASVTLFQSAINMVQEEKSTVTIDMPFLVIYWFVFLSLKKLVNYFILWFYNMVISVSYLLTLFLRYMCKHINIRFIFTDICFWGICVKTIENRPKDNSFKYITLQRISCILLWMNECGFTAHRQQWSLCANLERILLCLFIKIYPIIIFGTFCHFLLHCFVQSPWTRLLHENIAIRM